MIKKIILPLIIACLLISTQAFAARSGARPEAITLVHKAALFLKKNGLEKTLEELNNPKGKFIALDLYVMAADAKTGERLAHPYKPTLLGKSAFNAKDVSGKAYGEEIRKIAESGKSGWVSYKFAKPKTGEIAEKETYVLTVKDTILYCGIYKK
ncbi:MAG: hypothetical protein GY793_08910 [Proteobacteria bacterium]|nr:hypothetical protein [Pseudomonadota bacterium]